MPTSAQRWASLRTDKDSDGEGILTQQIAFDLSLPMPEREYHFAMHIGRKWRFDYAWVREGLAVEVEGAGPGGMGRHQRPDGFAKDTEKYNLAQTLGWVVFRFTTAQVEESIAIKAIKSFLEEHQARRVAR